MKELPPTIRGLINDLTRTLTASLVYMDDLFLQLDNDSQEFDAAWLATCQLERALEFLLELRSEYMIRQKSINKKRRNLRLWQLVHRFPLNQHISPQAMVGQVLPVNLSFLNHGRFHLVKGRPELSPYCRWYR